MWVWHNGDMPRSTNVVRSVWPQKRHPGPEARAVSESAATTLTLAFIPLLSFMRRARTPTCSARRRRGLRKLVVGHGPVHADLVTDHKLSAARLPCIAHITSARRGALNCRARERRAVGRAKCIDGALQHCCSQRYCGQRRLSRPCHRGIFLPLSVPGSSSPGQGSSVAGSRDHV